MRATGIGVSVTTASMANNVNSNTKESMKKQTSVRTPTSHTVRGVARGDPGGMAPNGRLSEFFTENLAWFSLPEVFCRPQICQKCVGAPQTA